MNNATISADIIAYTSLAETDRRKLESKIKDLLKNLSQDYREYTFFGRMVQGDLIECAIKHPGYALRIALLLKTLVKSFEPEKNSKNKNQLKYFKEHGLRLAIAIAGLEKLDPENGIIDGEAIYISGRAIKNQSTSDKQKIIIKNTMFFYANDTQIQEQFEPIISLVDTLISKCSARQSEILYYKLLNFSEKDISEKLGKYQSTISQHSTAAGWLSIEKAVKYFEKTIH
ncbi:MAG TPA: hypothetical protein VFD91_15115 [Mariniphaga sp.]|nr:hypothetical protein [Mariniphaga sp.]